MFEDSSDDDYLPLDPANVLHSYGTTEEASAPGLCERESGGNEFKKLVASLDSLPSTSSLPSFGSEIPKTVLVSSSEKRSAQNRRKTQKEISKPSTSSKQVNLPPSTCKVCGGVASGYHYDAPSCNGCKTHFRRIVVTGKKLICKKGGNCCVKSGIAARVCRSCRYDKCIQAGMDPRVIQLEDPDTNELLQDYLKNLKPETNVVALIPASPAPQMEEYHRLESTLSRLRAIEITSEILRARNMIAHPETTYIIDLLDVAESRRTPMITIKEMRGVYADHKNHMYLEMVNTLEYLKTFAFFHELCTADKIEWFKEVAVSCYNTFLSFHSYRAKSDSVVNSDGTINEFRPETPIDMHNYIFKRPVAYFIENQVDYTEYMLIRGIIACSCGNDKMSRRARQLISEEKENLALCLFRHTNRTMGMPVAASRFQQLLGVISSILTISGNHRNIMVLKKAENPHHKSAKIIDEIFLDNSGS